jgi:hypothetical protein
VAFWHSALPAPYAAAARAQQNWWISLFCATVQSLGLWMGALVHLGHKHRSAFAWGMLSAGLVLWAPQDIAISLQADCWPHVVVDLLAVAGMLPPMLWLWQHDRRTTLHHLA